METGKGVWLVLQDSPSYPLHGLFKIRPYERRRFGAVRRPVECEAPSSFRDCLKVGRGKVKEPAGEGGNIGICTKSYAIQVLREQPLATLAARQEAGSPRPLHGRAQAASRVLKNPGF